MTCTFEGCTAELSKRTRGVYCQRHRRVMYTRKWSNKHKEYSANRYQLEKEKVRARIASIPREKTLAKNKAWYQNNKDRAKKVSANWAKNNPHKKAKISAQYRASKLTATPKWLNDEQKIAIELFYKNRPKICHVDHIVPLQGKEVRGLHVPWNLQYLTISENCSKGNRNA